MLHFFKKDREKEKQLAIDSILNCICNNTEQFSHKEQTEIVNKVAIELIENKRQARKELIEEARELQSSIKNLRLLYPDNVA